MHSVALLTASYAKDIERFSLLSESIDTWLSGYTRHYVLVNDEDVPLFARFASDKRVIVPASNYLPKWLWALPPALQFLSKRRVWLSLLSSPLPAISTATAPRQWTRIRNGVQVIDIGKP